MRALPDGQAAALVAAGRLLQSRGWPGGPLVIDRGAGEVYPQSVARIVAQLDESTRARLRALVAWVRDYERGDTG